MTAFLATHDTGEHWECLYMVGINLYAGTLNQWALICMLEHWISDMHLERW